VRRRRAAVGLVAVVAVAVGVGVARARDGDVPSPVAAVRAVVAPEGDGGERCSVPVLTQDWTAGTLHLDVRSVATGDPLGGVRADEPASTGSTLKLLTAAAAVESLGPDATFATRVVRGDDPGTVVVVGGGDPTLSRLPTGQESVYPDAPHLDALAEQVLAARAADPDLARVPITTLQVDASLFGGPVWLDDWSDSARTSGSVPHITALMVDGDRDDPTEAYSRRSDAAVTRAATALAPLLGRTVSVDAELVVADADAEVLGEVRSAPVSTLVAHLLTNSDNALAEALGRHVALSEGVVGAAGGGEAGAGTGAGAGGAGAGASFGDVRAGVASALRGLDLPGEGVVLADASGLSAADALPASTLTSLLLEVARREGDLGVVDDGLAVAGRTGTLAEDGRFVDEHPEAVGAIRGKTGTLDDMVGLAAIAEPDDGRTVAFTIWAEDLDPAVTSTDDARRQVDALAADLLACGAGVNG